MTRSRIYIWGLIMLLLVGLMSCVKIYEPDLTADDVQKIVVSGRLTEKEGFQQVEVSMTTSMVNPKLKYLPNCKVTLFSSDGKSWMYTQLNDEKYNLWLNKDELDLTESYYIEVITPGGERIVSEPESFSSNPDVNKVYYDVQGYHNDFNNQDYIGLQFYIDLLGSLSDSRFFLFNVIETYEFHTKGPIEWWYDGIIHHEYPPDYSKSICWNTLLIEDLYVLSTDNLNKNEYFKLKLNYTDNHSQRLQHLYSLNIQQYAITKNAYKYWKQMQENMHQTGGLYNNQPYAIAGNLINETDPKKPVLGYFMVGSLKEKRIFIQPQNFDIIDNTCDTAVLRMGVREISPMSYPAFLTGNEHTYFNQIMSKTCVDCTADGGSTTKPVFWP